MHPISFEFFPPKTDAGLTSLQTAAGRLAEHSPDYFSVTFGAGGSTREGTKQTIATLQDSTPVETAPHISCVGTKKEDVTSLLDAYQTMGIKRLVALRGDIPSGMGATHGDFQYAADLVRFIREHSGSDFIIEVAAYPEFHPQAESAEKDILHFAEKVKAGANGAITQYFYNPDAYFRLVDDCAKLQLSAPIVPGIMPITNYSQLARFSDTCGAELPLWIRRRLQSFGDDKQAILQFGEEVVTSLCEKLILGGAPALHFYTLNKAKPALAILKNLAT